LAEREPGAFIDHAFKDLVRREFGGCAEMTGTTGAVQLDLHDRSPANGKDWYPTTLPGNSDAATGSRARLWTQAPVALVFACVARRSLAPSWRAGRRFRRWAFFQNERRTYK